MLPVTFFMILGFMVAGCFAFATIILLGWAFDSARSWFKHRGSKQRDEDVRDLKFSLLGALFTGVVTAFFIWAPLSSANDEINCMSKGYTWNDGVCYSQLERAE